MEARYNSRDLLCGIDGGGTTTKVVVCTLEGQIILSFRTGSINHYGAGTAKVNRCFAGISSRLKEELACIPGIIFIGNSALDGLAGDDLVDALTNGVFGASKVIFHSDVYITLLGFTLGEPGAVLIAGTGSMACGIDPGGNYHTLGGWGHILGDEGSGYHMALEGIQAGLRGHDGLSDKTLLSSSIMQHFQLAKLSDIIDKIYNPPLEKKVIAAFAPEIEIAAAKGDPVASNILTKEADWLYKLAICITERCNTDKLGFNGSVLEKNHMLRSRLTGRLQQASISLLPPRFRPEIGALIGAFREAHVRLDHKVLDKLFSYKQP